jgi:hypothetical protein
VRIAYADPPYPGMSHFYKDHPDYGGEVNHTQLVRQDLCEYDGWVLHTASAHAQGSPQRSAPTRRGCSPWVKPFASLEEGHLPIAYAWEPVILWGGRHRAFELAVSRRSRDY